MGKFLESEKLCQTSFKTNSHYFSDAARKDGFYNTKYRVVCLPLLNAEENLFHDIRDSALAFFAKHKIKWHSGQNGKSSNHMCDSQVCCVNFLFPFTNQPHALAELLRPAFPNLLNMLAIEDKQYVTFEWIGLDNHLGEKISRNGIRTRGANFTSVDAAVMFKRTDGKTQLVLIEWKYTESYSGTGLKYAKSGTDRSLIYWPLYCRDDCPIDKDRLPSYDAMFYEPFYQMMRQTLLAHAMEKTKELGADIVSVLHIAPVHNIDFRKVTSPQLVGLGNTAINIWKSLVKPTDRFTSVSTEDLFRTLVVKQLPEMQNWLDYIGQRYAWVRIGSEMGQCSV